MTPALFLATAARGRARAFFVFLVALCVIPMALAPVDSAPSQFAAPFVAIGIGVAWACAEVFVQRVATRLPTSVALLAIVLLVLAERLETTRLAPIAAIIAPMLIVYVLSRTALIDLRVAEWLSGRTISFAGRASYSIYLWQQLATGAYPGAGPLFYIASIFACVAWAAASFTFIETPLISLGRSLSARVGRTARAPRPVSA